MPRVGLKRAEMVTAALNAAEQRPRDNDRCDVCLYSRWYHRIAEALGETDHRFKEQEDK
jgi:hypothetical protein